MSEIIHCPKCGSDYIIKNGSVHGVGRKKCKGCGVTFSLKPKKYPQALKEKAIEMYLNNVGIRKIARFCETDPPLVLKWIKAHAKRVIEQLNASAAQIEAQGLPEKIEMDEIYTFVKKNPSVFRFGLLILGNEVRLLPIVSEKA